MNNLLLVLKGAIIGLANIIPGVSGGTLALILGIYERLIQIIGSFWHNFKENMKFVIPLAIGAVIAIVLGSKAIEASLDNYPIPTVLFFVGLILGGIPMMFKKIHRKYNATNILIFLIISVGFVLFLVFSDVRAISLNKISFTDYLLLFIIGVVSAGTMIIPGVSGSLVLMCIGYYDTIISAISNLTKMDSILRSFQILIPFGIGVVIGIILIARLITFLLNKFPNQTYFGIFGFIIVSIFGIIYKLNAKFDVFQLVIGLVLMVIGAVASYFIANIEKKEPTINDNPINEEKISE